MKRSMVCRLVSFVALSIAFSGQIFAQQRPLPPVPKVVKAEPIPAFDALFAGKSGWIGGDAAYSVATGPDRVLWFFGDSVFGNVKDGRREGTLVNNSVGVQKGLLEPTAIHFAVGKSKEGKTTALFLPSDGKGWLWPQGVERVGDYLFVFFPQLEKTTDPGVFGFKPVHMWLVVVANPDDEPEKWRAKQLRVPFARFSERRETSWGSAVIAEGDYVYVFGYQENKGRETPTRQLVLARAPRDKLEVFTSWRFRVADGWSENPGDAVPLADGLATEFSVSRISGGKTFAIVYTENGLSDRIMGRFSTTLDGPWSEPVLLYKSAEMARDKKVFSYAAKAHPWATNRDELVISYCVNSWDFPQMLKDDSIYRPKFIRVELAK